MGDAQEFNERIYALREEAQKREAYAEMAAEPPVVEEGKPVYATVVIVREIPTRLQLEGVTDQDSLKRIREAAVEQGKKLAASYGEKSQLVRVDL